MTDYVPPTQDIQCPNCGNDAALVNLDNGKGHCARCEHKWQVLPHETRAEVIPGAKQKPVRHIAGPYEDQVQHCIRCGCTLTDNRNTQTVRPGVVVAFREGIVIELGNGKSVGDDPNAVDCFAETTYGQT